MKKKSNRDKIIIKLKVSGKMCHYLNERNYYESSLKNLYTEEKSCLAYPLLHMTR